MCQTTGPSTGPSTYASLPCLPCRAWRGGEAADVAVEPGVLRLFESGRLHDSLAAGERGGALVVEAVEGGPWPSWRSAWGRLQPWRVGEKILTIKTN